jgi:hypothetical protein
LPDLPRFDQRSNGFSAVFSTEGQSREADQPISFLPRQRRSGTTCHYPVWTRGRRQGHSGIRTLATVPLGAIFDRGGTAALMLAQAIRLCAILNSQPLDTSLVSHARSLYRQLHTRPDLYWFEDICTTIEPPSCPHLDGDVEHGLQAWRNRATAVRNLVAGFIITSDALSDWFAAPVGTQHIIKSEEGKVCCVKTTALLCYCSIVFECFASLSNHGWVCSMQSLLGLGLGREDKGPI